MALALKENHHTAPITTPTGGSIALRMSLHVGVPQVDPSDPNNFVGKAVDYAARLNDLAAADQIIVSRAVLAILEDAGLDGVRFAPQGDADLKGIGRTPIFELLTSGASPKSIRRTPREQSLVDARWRVVPPTISLSQFGQGQYGGGSGGSSRAATAVGGLKRIGNYELVRLVGAGGMGNVYEARHQQFGRRRAVKVIKPLLVESGAQDVVRRFYREIKAIGALEHPNVVVAIDSSSPTDPVHYLVMEFLDGISADDLVLRNGPLRVADACEIVRQAAVGLEYIHKQGLVHRDVKPSNLMLTLVEAPSSADASASTTLAINPVVKILDLGLALLVGDDQSRLTQFNHGAMGTGMYMAPEQWKSASVDIRADIYSLGCTLYHLLAGRPPFFESDLRPEKAHEKEPPPPLRGRTDMPLELEQILTRMMAKNAAERFARPAEVAAALAPFTAGHALADFSAPPHAHRRIIPHAPRRRQRHAHRFERSARNHHRPARPTTAVDAGEPSPGADAAVACLCVADDRARGRRRRHWAGNLRPTAARQAAQLARKAPGIHREFGRRSARKRDCPTAAVAGRCRRQRQSAASTRTGRPAAGRSNAVGASPAADREEKGRE